MPILDLFKLDNKVAIITGASKGLGQGLALAMAEAGAHVVAVARTDCADTRNKIEALGRTCIAVQADLSIITPVEKNGPTEIQRIIDATIKAFGRIDILINNAGIIRRGDILDFSETDWDDVINVNQRSLFFLSQAAGKIMVKQGEGGRIINIASMLSYQGGIRVGSYTAAKSAVMGITRIFANELSRYGITVNAIAPGYMATDNTAPLRADEKRNAEILARIPAGRWGTPDDLKGTAVFLASAASQYMTGATVAVDGGWLSR